MIPGAFARNRRWARALFAGVALALAAAGADAAGWKPERPIEFVVGAGAGGNLDIAARAIQGIWEKHKTVPNTLIINKPGGAGTIASNYVSQHTGDPHYLMTFPMTVFTSQIMGNGKFLHTDFSPISMLFGQYVYVSVRADSPIRDGKDLIERLRKAPDSLTIAIATAVGNSIHMGFALPMKAAGVDVKQMRVVPFKSSGESMINLLGGHVDVAASTFGTILPHLKSGKVRVIGFSAPARLPGQLANVPTWKEQGANATFLSWLGIVGPKNLTPAQLAYWENAFATLAKSDEWQKDLDKNFRVDTYMNSRDTRKYLDEQYGVIRDILTEIGLAKAGQ
jgi:putative tricarboxylic transport membrane protein